ncbi:uncharacterized protein N7446_007917 [Penicillium canescens]|uniref:uncharacterized protein n=1 Tax=Penicillium canescens TaxID=5083 RepID=UPI0026E09803|nr:uncharacterized protein N7446_007866 [Penicillium canescens]XP_058370308.1 uncharacterized protein N7446_007917 [Penicillium canescens]KAJ6033790.1 hypothetical protein N7444_011561 [Penicillium canescens]KAJ6033843.1 hypothetical protein N7444_011614 [Penicillium canescens]KAJ6058283.1 hypothetical protein N7446_007866 [Penicillium canescens]KAJ6058334.1 hypothetical protein N7446_007917 [Penicillium canescens]
MTGDLEIPAKFELRDRYNRTDLWHAVSECNVAEVKLLLKSGRDALAADRDRVTPLNCAIMRNNILITRLLLKHLRAVYSMTTFLDDKDVNGAELPLCLAAEFERTQMIDLLLEFGADVNAANQRGHTPLYQAADQGRLTAVELLLEQQGINLQAQDHSGSTALHVATKRNHISIVNLLLANPNVDINCKDKHGNTPLWWSTRLKHDNISTRLLAEDGVDLNAVGWKSGLSTTSLYHAVERQNYSVAKRIVEKRELNPNILGCFRWTPLGHAARDGNVDMVELLLRRDDIRINAVDPGEDSPLWLATKCGRTKVVGLLLQQGNRVNINCRNNKESETALSAAAGSGDLHTVKLILRDARTDLNAVDKSGKTAIWHADSKGHLQVVKELLKDPRLSCDPESIASVAVNH